MTNLRVLIFCFLFVGSGMLSHLSGQACDCPPESNLVSNPDFSLGDTGFSSDLTNAMNCNHSTYFIGAEPTDKCDIPSWFDGIWDNTVGNATGSYMIIDGQSDESNSANNVVWGNTMGISEGTTYQFSFAAVSQLTQPVNTQLKLAFYVNSSNISGSVLVPLGTNWNEYCFDYTATYSGPAYIQIRQIGNFDPIGYDYGLDDIYFGDCQDPTPPIPPCDVESKWTWEQDPQTCEINFTNLSSAPEGSTIVGYFWEFPDGTTSTEANPSYFASEPGTQLVCLTVYAVNAEGECCNDKYCRNIINHCTEKPCTVKINQIYWSQFDGDDCAYQFGLDVDANRPIIGYYWDFGDGTTGTGPNPIHEFPASGTYEICVTVVLQDEDKCCSETICKKFVIDCGHGGTKPSLRPDEQIEPQQSKEETSNLKISPNPSDDWIQLEFSADEVQDFELQIFDLQGKQVQRQFGEAEKGITSYTLETANLPAGTYILTLRLNDVIHSEKLIIY